MITPSDPSYIATRQIMLGKAGMNPHFRTLADFIDAEFGVKVINIVYDTIDHGARPRLNVCFESEKEAQRFNANGGHLNFNSRKQAVIAAKFRDIAGDSYNTANIWIMYSAFEPIAKLEAVARIPAAALGRLKAELEPYGLWDIYTTLGVFTLFLHTDEQVRKIKDTPIAKAWADRCFGLVKQYDEFGYFSRQGFRICIDSKENVDRNYEGRLFYYFR